MRASCSADIGPSAGLDGSSSSYMYLASDPPLGTGHCTAVSSARSVGRREVQLYDAAMRQKLPAAEKNRRSLKAGRVSLLYLPVLKGRTAGRTDADVQHLASTQLELRPGQAGRPSAKGAFLSSLYLSFLWGWQLPVPCVTDLSCCGSVVVRTFVRPRTRE